MGQFKPMVKMETTEPSVELKLKKGGCVTTAKKMAGGGQMGAPMGALSVGARGGMAPAARPGKPSMADRRGAMSGRPISRLPMPPQAMAKGGESKAEHKAEMSKMKGLEKDLKSHADKPASKGHKGLKTGGVVDGQGGFKKGGSAKKAYATGGAVNNSGHAVAMPKKPKSRPVANSLQSGTFKKGGEVKMNAGGATQAQLDKAYKDSIGPSKEDMDMAETIRDIPGKLYRGAKSLIGMDKKPKAGSVTKTEKSITVEPEKKRGGSVKC